jgi:hypothetical protein
MYLLSFVFNFPFKLYIRKNFLKRAINYVDNDKSPHTLIYLYGREVWSAKFREKLKHRVFQNRVLGKTFGSKWQTVTGELGRLHSRELTISTLYQISLGPSSQRE